MIYSKHVSKEDMKKTCYTVTWIDICTYEMFEHNYDMTKFFNKKSIKVIVVFLSFWLFARHFELYKGPMIKCSWIASTRTW